MSKVTDFIRTLPKHTGGDISTAFKLIDASKDGKVSYQEVADYVKAHKGELTKWYGASSIKSLESALRQDYTREIGIKESPGKVELPDINALANTYAKAEIN